LAQFRCDEIAAASFQEFTSLLQPLKAKMEFGKLVDGLGPKMLEARTICLGWLFFADAFILIIFVEYLETEAF
jgi:hypothetical protein